MSNMVNPSRLPHSGFVLRPLSFIFLFFVLLLFVYYIPLPAYLDFQVIYHADMGLVRGIPLYDHAGQVNMIAELARVEPEQVYVLPFPYPPWYALSTIFLALLPIETAARLWFGLNLSMLLTSIWLLSHHEEAKSAKLFENIFPYLLAIFFLPVLGTLFVGQYTLPVLLGASLWLYAVNKQNAWAVALASILLTFKPHLGGLLLLAALVHLLSRRDAFGRRALTYTLGAGLLLFVSGFLVDPAWPVNYLRSLLAFRSDAGVASCNLCASLPVALVRLMTGQPSLASAPWIGLGLFLVLLAALVWTRRAILFAPHWLMAFSILAALLVNPYLLNYDFVLLLFVFCVLFFSSRSPAKTLLLVIAYLLPYLALGLWGREGNFAFSVSAIILLALTFRDNRQPCQAK
ncbi:MAG: glycosyltransferase family 87 protein [Chloroflexota bacterium]